MYGSLILGLLILGVVAYGVLSDRMRAQSVPNAPTIPLLAVFAAYGAVLLFAVSEAFCVWSGMHSLTAVALVLLGVPWLLIQGVLLLRGGTPTGYHRTTAALSLAFPAVLAGFVWAILRWHPQA